MSLLKNKITRKPKCVSTRLLSKVKPLIVCVSLFICLTNETFGQNENVSKVIYDLNETEIVGQRSPSIISDLSRSVVVISRAEIEQMHAQTIQEVLQRVQTIDIRQRGMGDIQSDISMGGGSFEQVLILINGIAINDPQTGHHTLDIPISLNQIESIEVLLGPGSRVLGPNAYSGAVNFITKMPTVKNIEGALSGGSFKYVTSDVAYTHVAAKSINRLSVSAQRSSGYVDNTDFKRFNAYYQGRTQWMKNKLDWQASFGQKNFGANSYYSAKYPHQFEKTQAAFAGIQHKYEGAIVVKTLLSYRGHTDRFELFRNKENAPSWYKNHNYHYNQSFGFNSTAYYNSKFGKTSFGVDTRFEDILSNVLGKKMQDTIFPIWEKDGFLTKYDNRVNLSLFLEQVYHYKKLSASAGLMSNYNSFTEKFNYFPGIDFSYQLSAFIKLYLTYNTSLRVPSFTDLYYSGPSNIGNPDLVPETAQNIALGAKYHNDWMCSEIYGNYSNSKNVIDWVRSNESEKWKTMNFASIESIGIQFSTTIYPSKFNFKYVESITLGYVKNFVSKDNSGIQSFYVMDYLRDKLVLSANHKIINNLALQWAFKYQDRNGGFLRYNSSTNTETSFDFKPFVLLDANMSYYFRQYKFFIKVSNILNKEYYDLGNIVQPKRWIQLGVNFSFDL